jgi:hypothetical protein
MNLVTPPPSSGLRAKDGATRSDAKRMIDRLGAAGLDIVMEPSLGGRWSGAILARPPSCLGKA